MKLRVGSMKTVIVGFAILVAVFGVRSEARRDEPKKKTSLRVYRPQQKPIADTKIPEFIRQTICVPSALPGGATYATVYAVKGLPLVVSRLQGAVPGKCGGSCAELCKHRACFSDFQASADGMTCECMDTTTSDCGNNSACIDDVCQCQEGYQGNPYSADGCKPAASCATGECLAGNFERCPSQDPNDCAGALTCARRSRTDSTYVCCARTGPCNHGFVCCNEAYSEGSPCPSKSRHDCYGELICAQRSSLDPTYVCCKEAHYPGLSDELVCKSS